MEYLKEGFFIDPSQLWDSRKHLQKSLWINGCCNPPRLHVKIQGTKLLHLTADEDPIALLEEIKSCQKQKDLFKVRRIHADILGRGLISKDIHIATTLLHTYAKCGAVKEACEVFDQLPHRDVVSWNALIAGYVNNGLGHEAMKCFRRMEDDGVSPSAVTYVSSLKACVIIGSFVLGEEIHSRVMKEGLLDRHVILGTALIDMYFKFGAIQKAQEVFDQLKQKDVVSWTALIKGYVRNDLGAQALKCFNQMEAEGISPNEATYSCILKACAIVRSLDIGEEIHAILKEKGLLNKSIVLRTVLVDTYCKCGAPHKAREVFDQFREQNVLSWNTLIRGYIENGLADKALQCFQQMKDDKVSPNIGTYISILKACAITGSLADGHQIYNTVRTKGLLDKEILLGTTLVYMYAKCGAFQKAHEVFNQIQQGDVVSWNALIAGYVENGLGDQALQCFKHMEDDGVSPNAVTYICCLKACTIVGCLEIGEEIHARVREQGLLKKDTVLATALFSMYAKSGELQKARDVFDQLHRRDVVSWTALIAGYVENGLGEEALKCFGQMCDGGVSPNVGTYICCLKACAAIGFLQVGEEIHNRAREQGLLSNDVELGTTLVDMYAKCGLLGKAHKVFDQLPIRDVVSWNALMAGYARVGQVNVVLDFFERMKTEGTLPNLTTFLVLLNGCSHAALLDKGERLFEDMILEYGLKPTVEHYTCMVDVLGRAGQLEKAKLFLLDEVSLLMAFLGACHNWVNVELGRWAFDKLVQLDEKCASAYVCMANIYAAAGMQTEADKIEAFRVKHKAWKILGRY